MTQPVPTATPDEARAALRDAGALVAAGRHLEALDLLSSRALGSGVPEVEIRLSELRYAAYADLEAAGPPSWPVPTEGVDRSGPAEIPEVEAADLTVDAIRRAMQSRGSLLVRGLFADHTERFVEAIDTALASRGTEEGPWWRNLPLPREEAVSLGRHWVAGGGGLLACDSPHVLDMLFTTYTELGLREIVGGYLGERPVLSGNKCTLRRVPIDSNTDWHQDGAFLGEGIRTLNVWLALNHCGDTAPGLDVLPKRLDEIAPTGTEGALFPWAVSDQVANELAGGEPIPRPIFEPGDALLFDHLCLHRTAAEDDMPEQRYATETWCFAPSAYPEKLVPLVI
jgi:hypothetical protein